MMHVPPKIKTQKSGTKVVCTQYEKKSWYLVQFVCVFLSLYVLKQNVEEHL